MKRHTKAPNDSDIYKPALLNEDEIKDISFNFIPALANLVRNHESLQWLIANYVTVLRRAHPLRCLGGRCLGVSSSSICPVWTPTRLVGKASHSGPCFLIFNSCCVTWGTFVLMGSVAPSHQQRGILKTHLMEPVSHIDFSWRCAHRAWHPTSLPPVPFQLPFPSLLLSRPHPVSVSDPSIFFSLCMRNGECSKSTFDLFREVTHHPHSLRSEGCVRTDLLSFS